MTDQPTGCQNKSEGAPDKSTSSPKHQEESAAAYDYLDAADTSKGTSLEDGPDGTTDVKSTLNRTANENATSIPSKESSNAKATKHPIPVKVKVHLVAVGSAPILKKSKFLMNADDRFAVAIAFLRKVLKLSAGKTTGASAANSLFLYVNAAFVPSPDERMGDLFDCFGTRGELVVHYSLQEAWG